MSNHVLISVIIPVYNGAAFIAEALASIAAQNLTNIEIIVIDDGSTDDSAAIVRGFSKKVRYVYQTNAGIGAARNHGIALTQGDLLAFLDADDRWPPNKLERQINYLNEHPEIDLVFGQARQFISPELPPEVKKRISCPTVLMPAVSAGSMLIRKTSFLKVGYFATNIKIGEFVDWYARAVEAGLKSEVLSFVCLERRLHNTNQGVRERQSRLDYIRVLKASLDRRRS